MATAILKANVSEISSYGQAPESGVQMICTISCTISCDKMLTTGYDLYDTIESYAGELSDENLIRARSRLSSGHRTWKRVADESIR